MLSSHTVGFQRPDNSNLANLTPGSDKHLGNFMSSDIQDRNVISSVCDVYQRSNSIISDFSSCNSVSLDSLHNTF